VIWDYLLLSALETTLLRCAFVTEYRALDAGPHRDSSSSLLIATHRNSSQLIATHRFSSLLIATHRFWSGLDRYSSLLVATRRSSCALCLSPDANHWIVCVPIIRCLFVLNSNRLFWRFVHSLVSCASHRTTEFVARTSIYLPRTTACVPRTSIYMPPTSIYLPRTTQ